MPSIRLFMPSYSRHQAPVQPLGLYYIKACLEQHGYTANVHDLNLKPLSFGSEEVVGVSCTTFLFSEAAHIIREAKARGKIVLCGGAHAWSDAQSLIDAGADYCVEGDGEYAALDLMSALEAGQAPPRGTVISKPVSDLDALPFPEHVRYPTSPVIATSRGCPFLCSFCSTGHVGRKWRPRSPEKVVEEMSLLDGEDLQIADDLFTLDAKRLDAIQRLMQKEKLSVSITIGNGTRVDMVDEQRLKALQRMNCLKICYGIESIDDGVLKQCNKGTTFEKVKHAVSITRKVGIPQELFMMIGLPGDDAEKCRRGMEWVASEGLPSYWNIATPYPRTAMFEWVSANGRWLIDPCDYTQYGGHFGTAGRVVFDTPEFPAEQRLALYRHLNASKGYSQKRRMAVRILNILGMDKREALAYAHRVLPAPLVRMLAGRDHIEYIKEECEKRESFS